MGAKRFCCILLMTLLLPLAACGAKPSYDQQALALRTDYLAMTTCEGAADITADYGQRVYEYSIDFSWQRDGETVLTLTSPDEVEGVTARIEQGETLLEFDQVALETGPLAEDGLAPIDCIPAMLEAIQSGYIAQCGEEVLDGITCLRLEIRNPDDEVGQGVRYSLWIEPKSGALIRGEIAQDGFTVIHCTFTAFTKELP